MNKNNNITWRNLNELFGQPNSIMGICAAFNFAKLFHFVSIQQLNYVARKKEELLLPISPTAPDTSTQPATSAHRNQDPRGCELGLSLRASLLPY